MTDIIDFDKRLNAYQMRNKLIFKFGFCLLKLKTALKVGKEI